jgi:prepilin-type N-terminal cleavage/methylation domain-containing protein
VCGATQHRAGFTLVELIVVIVILGILAAIAIPALTGYISKAEDKEWEMKARDINIAMHAVIDEAWSHDEFGSKAVNSAYATNGFENGNNYVNIRFFQLANLASSAYGSGSSFELYHRTAALLGEEYIESPHPGSWLFFPLAAMGSDATAATADGFYLMIYPDGSQNGGYGSQLPVILVTYKVPHVDGLINTWNFIVSFFNGLSYDASAGYEVYYLVE